MRGQFAKPFSEASARAEGGICMNDNFKAFNQAIARAERNVELIETLLRDLLTDLEDMNMSMEANLKDKK